MAIAEVSRADNAKRLAAEYGSRFGLVLLLVLLGASFSIFLPDTFATSFTWQTILSSQAVPILIALGLVIPFSTGNFDLSVGAWLGFSENLVTGLQARQGIGWVGAILIVLAVGVVIGYINGLIVTRLKVSSFIATLGTQSVIAGIASWYTGGQQSLTKWPAGFLWIGRKGAFWVPTPFWLALIVCLIVWIVLDFTPVGRRMYVLGSNPQAARLVGISEARYVPSAFAVCSVLTGMAGIMLASQQGVGIPGVGPEYLLPAFVGAILGSAAIRPGRVNAWGSIIAVLVLAVGIAGLLQLGVQSWIQDVFNGVMLLAALAAVGFAERRRQQRSAIAETTGGAPVAAGSAVFPDTTNVGLPGSPEIVGGE